MWLQKNWNGHTEEKRSGRIERKCLIFLEFFLNEASKIKKISKYNYGEYFVETRASSAYYQSSNNINIT